MEEELKCSYCADFYCNPVLLPCNHSLCYACALHLMEKLKNNSNNSSLNISSASSTMMTPKRHISSDISANINTAMANAAKSASTLIAMSSSSSSSSSSSGNGSSTTSASISPQSSISSSSSINMDHRALSVTDLGSSIISDLDKLSIFSEADSGVDYWSFLLLLLFILFIFRIKFVKNTNLPARKSIRIGWEISQIEILNYNTRS